VSPMRYEFGSYIPEDGILRSHRRENFKSYNFYSLPTIASFVISNAWNGPRMLYACDEKDVQNIYIKLKEEVYCLRGLFICRIILK
jgi:hypothetical protein